jgi:hypothetical protein
MTYGEMKIVLKGGKGARRSPRAGKKDSQEEKKMFMPQRSSGILCQNADLLRLNGNMRQLM